MNLKLFIKSELYLYLMVLGLLINFTFNSFHSKLEARNLASNQFKQLYIEDGVGAIPVNQEEFQMDLSFFLYLSLGLVFFANQTQLSFFNSSIFCFKKISFHLLDIPPPAFFP